MRTLTVDSSNDLIIKNGSLSISQNTEAVMHSCQQAVQAQYGEMIFAIEKGIPYNLLAWDNTPNLIQLEAYIRKAILAVPNVLIITNLEISASKNAINYSATINTTYGEITLNDLRLSK